MSNFDFLNSTREFSTFSEACIKAESSIGTSPALCALCVYKSAELAYKWLYSVDSSINRTYMDHLSASMFNSSFIDTVDEELIIKLRYIIKLGNNAANTSSIVSYEESVVSLSNLFDFVNVIDYRYGYSYNEGRRFDESLLPTAILNQQVEYNKFNDEIEKRSDELGYKAVTRKTFIDVDLKAAGWSFNQDCCEEVPVVGMSDDSRNGYVDCVLYDDYGKPLAVVEYKNTLVHPEKGRHQAKLYADCLEKMTGQRPLVFYTNGYDIWFWDDLNYPERKVYSVFTKEELQLIINRRKVRQPLKQTEINQEIADRQYQKDAINSVCEEFSKGRRKSLLVMATGTGKTLTAISLVNKLMANESVNNVLFLSENQQLVKQTKQMFSKHMPKISSCNLTRYEKGSPTNRALFSTYPQIIRGITEEKNDKGRLLFTPAHFDLIIIEEVQSSLLKKYKDVLNYFDSLLIGFTATPINEIDKEIYNFFELEEGKPTFEYGYNSAVSEKHLVHYNCIKNLSQIPNLNFARSDLLAKEKKNGLIELSTRVDNISHLKGGSLNSYIYDIKTNQKVIIDLMEKGIKVDSGDKIGKTIIFAQNIKHAKFIKEQFYILYPNYDQDFVQVINNNERLIAKFKNPSSLPRIAISVNTLRTGIDIPEVVNLVFFSRPSSRTEYLQMLGRGTRLCEDLLGPGEDKKEVYVFDYLKNFEQYEQNPNFIESSKTESLAERSFKLKIKIIKELQERENQSPEYKQFRKNMISELIQQISKLNSEQFLVRQELHYIDKYNNQAAFKHIDSKETEELLTHIAYLISAKNEDIFARRFDVIMYKLELAMVVGSLAEMKSIINKVRNIAINLLFKTTIPQVLAKKNLLDKIQKDEFWITATLMEMDQVRVEMHDLLKYLKEEMKSKIINLTDNVLFAREGEPLAPDKTNESYYQRAERYIRDNEEDISIQKLRYNQILTENDWSKLERMLWQEVGTKEEYEREFENADLGKFVRYITGLSSNVAYEAFSKFYKETLLTEGQMFFINTIVEYLINNGTFDLKELKRQEVTGGQNLIELFKDKNNILTQIVATIKKINKNAIRQIS